MKKILLFIFCFSMLYADTLHIGLMYIPKTDPCILKWDEQLVYFNPEKLEITQDGVIIHTEKSDLFGDFAKDEIGYYIVHFNTIIEDIFDEEDFDKNLIYIPQNYAISKEEPEEQLSYFIDNEPDLTLKDEYVPRYWEVSFIEKN